MICPSCGQDNAETSTFCSKCGKNLAPNAATPQPVAQRSRRGLGLFILVLPFISLIIILSAFAITQFVIGQLIVAPDTTAVLGEPDPRETIANIIRIALSFLGILSVLGIFICVPIGIVLMRKKTVSLEGAYDARSGKGSQSIVPDEIRGWNWGAAGLGWIWGVYFNVWISLLNFIPFVNIVFWIVMGLKGNEWAWRKNPWLNVQEFQAAQNKWKVWGILFFGLWVLQIVGLLLGN